MDKESFIAEVARKDADISSFARLAVSDQTVRDEVVHQMVSNADIMVYYHCFYVVDQASQTEPALFTPYWEEIASLLTHKNSYHRNFALTILANLTAVDSARRFESLLPAYLDLLDDEKMMTAQCCLQNCKKIIRHQPQIKKQVVDHLLGLDAHCRFSTKQKELLKADVLAIIAEAAQDGPLSAEAAAFIRASTGSISPKTKKKAKELAASFGL